MTQQTLSNLNIRIAREHLVLMSEKAILLPDHDTLLIADLHFGKIEHFRKNGFALPKDAARKGIEKLDQLIEKANANHIVFMGDLFHSDYNKAWEAFNKMLNKWPNNKFTLIIGNHDILDVNLYKKMTLTYELTINDLILTHEPLDTIIDGKYNLCGHIHPGVRLRGKGLQSLRLPCFYFGKHTGILPSFGTFTGLHVIKPIPGDSVYVVEEGIVMKVNS